MKTVDPRVAKEKLRSQETKVETGQHRSEAGSSEVFIPESGYKILFGVFLFSRKNHRHR
jgi:hypothetical protein